MGGWMIHSCWAFDPSSCGVDRAAWSVLPYIIQSEDNSLEAVLQIWVDPYSDSDSDAVVAKFQWVGYNLRRVRNEQGEQAIYTA